MLAGWQLVLWQLLGRPLRGKRWLIRSRGTVAGSRGSLPHLMDCRLSCGVCCQPLSLVGVVTNSLLVGGDVGLGSRVRAPVTAVLQQPARDEDAAWPSRLEGSCPRRCMRRHIHPRPLEEWLLARGAARGICVVLERAGAANLGRWRVHMMPRGFVTTSKLCCSFVATSQLCCSSVSLCRGHVVI